MRGPIRILLTVLGLVVVAAVMAVVVVVPVLRRTEADRIAIQDRRAQLVKLQRVAARINNLTKEIERLEEALAFFEDRLPEEREIDVILREVWLIAESKSMTPRSVRTNAPETMPRYNSLPITLSLEGPFGSFYEFLLGLERLPRLTKVRQMQVTKSPMTEGLVQVDLLMDIFFEK
ncbi:MAG TPA: type 4a pilus biogenesis protein PilO [Phycisphaerae bacterium]|nr:type 4a pilus biogenesis protein PilO [Phycisphaerae bacterium]